MIGLIGTYLLHVGTKDSGDNLRLQKGFEVIEGPFVKVVETALASLNVQCQQYHSGEFIGNHVNKLLQVKSNNKYKLKYNLLLHIPH